MKAVSLERRRGRDFQWMPFKNQQSWLPVSAVSEESYAVAQLTVNVADKNVADDGKEEKKNTRDVDVDGDGDERRRIESVNRGARFTDVSPTAARGAQDPHSLGFLILGGYTRYDLHPLLTSGTINYPTSI